jgi:F0F1-type ATP synthase assembly protein I
MSAKAKPDKAAKAEAKIAKKAESKQRRQQMFKAFNMQRKQDKLLIPLMLGALLGATAIAYLIGHFTGSVPFVLPLGIALGTVIAVFIMGRRMQRSVYKQADGQPGAAGWALDNMRGQWRVTQAVAGTTQMDAVHRVIGRPGVILVAEGAPHRVRGLLAQEKKRVARLAGKIPIYDVTVGNEEGQVPLRKLQMHISKLPRNITAKQMDTLEGRLSALSARSAGLPKGPLPPGAKMRNVQRAARRRDGANKG